MAHIIEIYHIEHAQGTYGPARTSVWMQSNHVPPFAILIENITWPKFLKAIGREFCPWKES